MSYALRIEFADGSTETLEIIGADGLGDDALPSLQSLSITRHVVRQPEQVDEAEAAVYRDAWAEIEDQIDRTDDKVFIENPSGTDIFGGRFRDWQYSGAAVSILLDDSKIDAVDGEPSGGNDLYSPQADSDILKNELLSRVDTVSAGTINGQRTTAFSEQHASPGKSIQKLARDADAEVQYQPDFTLDYIGRLGTDKTGTTLSSDASELIGEPRKQADVKETVTHVRVLGAGEGTQQVQAEATAASYSSGDRQIWRKFTDKDIQEQSRVQNLADDLVAEYDGEPERIDIEVELAPAVDPAVGDSFTLDLPKLDIDNEAFRIMRLEHIIDEAGERFRALFSNRKKTREQQGEQEARSVESLNQGNAGQYYSIADGKGWDAVGSGEPYEFSFYRPQNTIDEYRAVIQLESREYRLRADQVGHSHDVSVTHPSHSHSVNATSSQNTENSQVLGDGADSTATQTLSVDTWETVYSQSQSTTDTQLVLLGILGGANDGSNHNADVRLKNTTSGDTHPESDGASVVFPDGHQMNVWFAEMRNSKGDTLELQVRNTESSSWDLIYSGWAQAVDTHTHDISDTTTADLGTTETATTDSVAAVNPGINTIANEQVSNVSVDVGGTTVASGLSAPIDETIDISGELSDGSNPISISSDSLGSLSATVEYEALKNATK